MNEPYNRFSGQSVERLTAVASIIALAVVQLYFIVSPRMQRPSRSRTAGDGSDGNG